MKRKTPAERTGSEAAITAPQARGMRWGRPFGLLFLLSLMHPQLLPLVLPFGVLLSWLSGRRRLAGGVAAFWAGQLALTFAVGMKLYSSTGMMIGVAVVAMSLLTQAYSGMRAQLLSVHRSAYAAAFATMPALILREAFGASHPALIALMVVNALAALSFAYHLPRHPGLEQLRRDLGLESSGLARGRGRYREAELTLERDGSLRLTLDLPDSQLQVHRKGEGGSAKATGHLILDQLLDVEGAKPAELLALRTHPELALRSINEVDCCVLSGQLQARFPVDKVALRADPAAYSAQTRERLDQVLDWAERLRSGPALASEEQHTQARQPSQPKTTT